MPQTWEPDKPAKKPRSQTRARALPESPSTQGRGKAGTPAPAIAYEQFVGLTTDGIWRYDVVPSVSTRRPPREQAEAILARARLGFCNPAFARLYGSERPEDLVGLPLASLLAGSEEEKIRFVAESVGRGYRLADIEAATRDPAGRVVWTLNTVAGVVQRGRLVGGWGSSRDITDQKRAEAALREAHDGLRASEERLNLALGAASDGVYDIDLRSGVSYYSPGYYTMLGFEPGEFAPSQEAWESLLHPADKARALAMLDRCVNGTAGEAETEFRLRTKAGEWRHIVSRGRVMSRDEAGRALRLVGTHRDVTARWEAAEAVRQERDRAQAYLDIAGVMLVALDREGTITLINAKGCRLLGYEHPSDLIGKSWFATCLPEPVVDATHSVFRRIMEGELEAVEYYENPILAKSGERIEMAWHNALLRDGDGRVTGTLSSGEDITLRRKAEQALENSVALLSQSEEISHVGSWELNVATGHLVWSDELYRIFGLVPRDVPPSDRLFGDVLHPDDRGAVGAAYARALQERVASYESSHRVVRRMTGEVRHVHEKCAFERDETGEALRVFGIVQDITEKRKAEDALHMSARVFEHSIDMLCVAGFDGYFKSLNPSWERTLGWSTSEILARPWIEFVHPDDRAATQEARSTLVDGREVYQFENRYVCKDGSIKWLSWNSFPYPAEGVMFGVARDVTEAKRASVALRDSEEKYRLLVENAGEAVFVAQDGVLRFANLATARILGCELQDLVGRPFADLVHSEDRATVVDRHLRRMSGEEEIEQGYAFRVIHSDGGVRWVEINAVRIDWEGRPATLNFAGDITARRAAENARRESEERFGRIFEESPIGMVTVGLDFRFTRANDAFCHMLGYTEDELLQKTFVDITHPEHAGADIEAVKRVARGEIPSYRTEKRYVRKDGGVVWGALTASAMRDAEGRVQYFLSMVEDITARKESEAALEESERRYRELANDLPTCVFEAGLDGRVTYANRTGLGWFGYGEDEIVGVRNIAEMVVEDERDQARRTFRTAAEKGAVPAGEYTAVRKDGTTFPALVSSRAMVRDGQTIGVRGILIDISERLEAAQRIERALTGTIHALAVTTEMRDPYTAGHQERVARLAVAIARRMELPEARIEGLRVAGLLHDVGKVSVPAEILSKPTELSKIEMGLVRSHSETGHVILREIDFPWPVAAIVLQHHERMDGCGYPNGLRGDGILLEARILAVADTVEAMASHRPYRAAFGISEALAEIDRGRGGQYDEAVAAACLLVFERDGFRFDA